MIEDDFDSNHKNRWHNWNDRNSDDYALTCDEEFEDWYGPVDELEEMNEGVRRRFSIEGFDENPAHRSIDNWFKEDFDYMASNPFMPNERYAIGYIRVSGKSDKTMPSSAAHYNAAVRRVYYENENKEQEFALRKYVRENRFIKFHTFPEFQSSDPTTYDPFFWMKFTISLCVIKRATLIYCELGSIFKHTEFFSLVRYARRSGVKVIPVRNLMAIESAQHQIPKRSMYSKKGVLNLTSEKKKAIALDRHPILAWKEKRKIPTKLFKTYEHLFYGADSIYKFFLSVRTKDKRSPLDWKAVNDYDKNIADALHQAGHHTVEDHRWSKQLVRKARLMIWSDEFKDYCTTKFKIEDRWESGESIVAEEV